MKIEFNVNSNSKGYNICKLRLFCTYLGTRLFLERHFAFKRSHKDQRNAGTQKTYTRSEACEAIHHRVQSLSRTYITFSESRKGLFTKGSFTIRCIFKISSIYLVNLERTLLIVCKSFAQPSVSWYLSP